MLLQPASPLIPNAIIETVQVIQDVNDMLEDEDNYGYGDYRNPSPPPALTTDTRKMDKEVVMAMMTGHEAEWDTLADNMIGWSV